MANDTAAYARAYVKKYGLRLVKIEPGSKAPKHPNWNVEGGYFSTIQEASDFYEANPTWNMGVVLGPSRLCSLDIDNVSESKQVLAEFGVDIDAYAAMYPTIVGNPLRFRVEFALPEGVELSRHSLSWPDQDAPHKTHTVFELRAGGVQDVFPPSIHPETQRAYTWLTKPNGHFPTLPKELLAIWTNWDIFVNQAKDLCPWRVDAKPKRTMPYEPKYKPFQGGESVILNFNQAHDVGVMLVKFGYEQVGERWLSPHSHTKLPGVVSLGNNKVFIHHASDPLFSDPPHPIGPFDLYCYYEHAGDVKTAVREAAKLLGMNQKAEAKRIAPSALPEDAHAIDRQDTKTTPAIEQLSQTEQTVRRLAQLDVADYEVVRKKEAAQMNVRASVLDKLVENARQAQMSNDEPLQPIEFSSHYALWQALGLDLTKSGPICNLHNCVLVMTRMEGIAGQIWYDEFSHRVNSDLFHNSGEWTDYDTLQLTLAMQRDVGLSKISSIQVREAVVLVARNNVRNAPKEYMDSLSWDGTPRLESMIPKGWGADDNIYSQAVGRCWMVSMVARVYDPGCKVDTVPVFEGRQGLFKSTALSVIGGKWYAECNEPVNNKDFYMILEGRLMVEIAEMHSFSAGEIRRVKGVISTRTDRYRAPYAATVEDHPRQAVLVCTTNEEEWNRDPTGARRFWPIRCLRVDLDWLKENRDQLFAEAVHLYRTDHIWHDVPEEEARLEQAARISHDVWDGRIADFVRGKQLVSTRMIMETALELDSQHQSPAATQRVSSIMKIMGWEQRLVKRGDARVRGWVKMTMKAVATAESNAAERLLALDLPEDLDSNPPMSHWSDD